MMKTDPVLPGKELREHPEPAVNPDIYSLSTVRAVRWVIQFYFLTKVVN